MSTSQVTYADNRVDLKSAVLRSTTTNPAIERLKARVTASAEPSEVITSYDRMHHRHSRS